MKDGFCQWVPAHPKLVLLLVFLTLPLALAGAKNIELATDYKIYFKPNNPQLQAMEALEATYGKEASVILVVAPKSRDVFDSATLEVIAAITEDFWQLPFAGRVESLTNYQYSYAEGEDDLIVEPLFEEPGSLSEEKRAWGKAALLAEPSLVGRLLSKEAHAALIYGSFNLRGSSVTEVPKISAPARDLLARYRAAHPAIDFYLTGSIMADQTFTDATQQDLSLLVPLSYLIIVVLLALLLRSLTGTLLTLVVVAFSILYAVGIWAWYDGAMNPVVVSAPSIIMTIAVADCVHLCVTCFQQMRQGLEKRAAVVEAMRLNVKPICITSVTTVLGFLCLNFGESPPFQQLGNLVAIGVTAAMILSLTFLPAAFMLLPVKSLRTGEILTPFMSAFGRQVTARSGLFLCLLLPCIALLFIGLPRNHLSETFSEFFDETFEIKQAYNYVDGNVTGLHRLIFDLDAGQEGAVNDPDYLAKVEAFAAWLGGKPEVAHVHAFSEIGKRLNKNMHGDDPAFYRLPQERELAAQYLLLYEFSLPFGADLNNQLSQDKARTRLVANLWLTDSDTILRVASEAEQWLKENATASMPAPAVGIDVMFSEIARANIPSMVFGSLAALTMISLLIGLVLGSLKLGGVSLLSNLLPILMAFGFWGFFSGRIGLGEAVVASVTLGLVVDDTVHFLSKYQSARLERGLAVADAIRYTFSTVGVALLITTIVLGLGFAVLMVSHYSSSANFGLLTAATILLALAVDLILLPAILLRLDRGDEARDAAKASA